MSERQAGSEIEITPEMIEAGGDAIAELGLGEEPSVVALVTAVYRAMCAASDCRCREVFLSGDQEA